MIDTQVAHAPRTVPLVNLRGIYGGLYLDALRPGMFHVLNQAARRGGGVSGLSAVGYDML